MCEGCCCRGGRGFGNNGVPGQVCEGSAAARRGTLERSRGKEVGPWGLGEDGLCQSRDGGPGVSPTAQGQGYLQAGRAGGWGFESALSPWELSHRTLSPILIDSGGRRTGANGHWLLLFLRRSSSVFWTSKGTLNKQSGWLISVCFVTLDLGVFARSFLSPFPLLTASVSSAVFEFHPLRVGSFLFKQLIIGREFNSFSL